ncbi:S9 family peptidase [Qipengyuania gelatinilytica]|uniref:S9 family peptidase n=1 Tax=Qipengyuania gelatinilytica TaxID=2867231 RepID=A0ABX9A3T0_9SPHN|nr:S9 family peptidase [Qipengyuania gelatinilytica]QZD94477.1 S9 family peptidase [Qipengyuania gelatinilytica]
MKAWIGALAIAAGAWGPAALAQDEGGESERLFTSLDVFDLEYADDPRISPDGRHVLYTRRSNNIMTDRTEGALWLAALDGSSNRLVLDGASGGEWSPDGRRIAYSGRDEDGRSAIFIRWMDSGQVQQVAALDSGAGNLAWSPDGRQIAFTSRVDGDTKPLAKAPPKPEGAKWSPPVKVIDHARYRSDGSGFIDVTFSHVFVVPADGGTPRQLTTGEFDHAGPLAWTRDGGAILVSANRNEGWELQTIEGDIWRVPLAGGAMQQVTSGGGLEASPQVSPDGRSVAFICMPNVKRPVWQVDVCVRGLDGSGGQNLTESLDREVSDIRWSGRHIYFTYDDRGIRKIGRVSPSGSRVETVADGLGGTTLGRPYTSGTYDVHANGALAWTQGSHDRPADLYAKSGRSTRKLTALNEDLLAHRDLGQVQEVTYTSSHDGTEIQGWYVTPPGFDPSKKYPLILEIHGGPHAAYGPHFSAEIQRYVAEGYVVFYANHRGSSSYGEDFGLLLEHKYSSPDDAADHMSGVDAMIAKGFIDEDNLFVTGGSAGGIATAYLVGLTDRFNAAAAAKPVINWLSKTLTADSYIFQTYHQFPGLPWEVPMHYWERSPLSLVGNVTTPTMLLTGEEDQRTPITESEQFYQALKLRGIDTVLVRVPESPHGIASRPSRLVAKADNILAWFERYRTDQTADDNGSDDQ